MRRWITTAFLFSASAAFAQVKVVGELAVPAAPAVSGASALNATFTALPPALSLTPTALTPSLTPVATPIAVLTQTGAALSAPSKEGSDPASISRRTFDAAAKTPAAAPEVTGRESASRVVLEPRPAIIESRSGPVKTAAIEAVETAAVTIPFAFGAMILRGAFADPVLLTGSMLALWGLAFWAMRAHLASLRSTVVGGWQASHDQKYRTDYSTGLQRDIRGQKYGADRYEAYEDGPVGPRALTAIAAATALGAAAFLLL